MPYAEGRTADISYPAGYAFTADLPAASGMIGVAYETDFPTMSLPCSRS